MLKYSESPLSAAILRTFSKWRGGPVRAFLGGASLETFSGEAQLKKSPCIYNKFHQLNLKQIIDGRFYSLAATLQGRIVGLIVAETKELGQVGRAAKMKSSLQNIFIRHLIDPIFASCQFQISTKIARLIMLC